ncbi:MAG: lipopolysaccharide kinase InaA family protein [Culturomica sp.]|jgi:hypothetical protein|nr:lipopolysaccharide kinase InaA family protein [Culturomica sp.]
MPATIVIHPKYKELTDFIVQLPETFSRQGKVIYNGRNEIRVVEHAGLTINVKEFGIPFFLNRPVYAWFRKTKAERAYLYAGKLLTRQICTPEPIAYILTKKWGVIGKCYFVSIQVPLARNFYEFGTPPLEGREDIVKDFARYTACIHDSGVYHKDYSPGNILFDVIDGKTEFCLVDINRMEFGRVNIRKGCKNFARLWGQEPFFRLIGQEYAQSRKADPQTCIRLILKYRKKFWKNFIRKHTPKFRLDI